MLRKVLSFALAGLLFNLLAIVPAHAQTQDDRVAHEEKVRQSIRKLGTGEDARVEVKLYDGRKLKGYIYEAREYTFVLVEPKAGTSTTIDYSNVKELKGRNRSTAAKVAIGAAKGVAIVGAVALGFSLLMLIFIPKT